MKEKIDDLRIGKSRWADIELPAEKEKTLGESPVLYLIALILAASFIVGAFYLREIEDALWSIRDVVQFYCIGS